MSNLIRRKIAVGAICAPGEAITEAVRPLEKAAAGLRSATAFRYAHSDHQKVKPRMPPNG
jgi:hypothetical protein